MRRILIFIEYDGTHFVGWQFQPNGRTVQNVIEESLEKLFTEKIRIHGSGRTDAGVHASYQVAHFDLEHYIDAEKIPQAINTKLPADVQVNRAIEVDKAFSARHDAVMRRYRYYLSDCSTKPIRAASWIVWSPGKRFPETKMHEAAQNWIGEHDFSAFRPVSCQAKTPIRSITRIDVERIDLELCPGREIIRITVEAPSFLQHQVRTMVGTLMEIGRCSGKVSDAKSVIDSRDRSKAGPTALPHGLVLDWIDYGDRLV